MLDAFEIMGRTGGGRYKVRYATCASLRYERRKLSTLAYA